MDNFKTEETDLSGVHEILHSSNTNYQPNQPRPALSPSSNQPIPNIRPSNYRPNRYVIISQNATYLMAVVEDYLTYKAGDLVKQTQLNLFGTLQTPHAILLELFSKPDIKSFTTDFLEKSVKSVAPKHGFCLTTTATATVTSTTTVTINGKTERQSFSSVIAQLNKLGLYVVGKDQVKDPLINNYKRSSAEFERIRLEKKKFREKNNLLNREEKKKPKQNEHSRSPSRFSSASRKKDRRDNSFERPQPKTNRSNEADIQPTANVNKSREKELDRERVRDQAPPKRSHKNKAFPLKGHHQTSQLQQRQRHDNHTVHAANNNTNKNNNSNNNNSFQSIPSREDQSNLSSNRNGGPKLVHDDDDDEKKQQQQPLQLNNNKNSINTFPSSSNQNILESASRSTHQRNQRDFFQQQQQLHQHADIDQKICEFIFHNKIRSWQALLLQLEEEEVHLHLYIPLVLDSAKRKKFLDFFETFKS